MKKMTTAEARRRIRDAIASEMYEPQHGLYWFRGQRKISGCAICALYVGCGGEQPPGYVSRIQQEAFLESGATATPVRRRSLDRLESGFEWGSKKVAGDDWYNLGIDLKDGKL